MDAKQLIDTMATLGLEKPTLARLLGVTVRAVNNWIAGDREIPGPAEAYLRLFQSLPRAMQAAEVAKLENNAMTYDGLYLVEYEGRAGTGSAALVFMNGVVFGHDGGVQYDGSFEPSPGLPNHMDVRLRLIVPPGVALVQGVPPQPAEYNFTINVRVPTSGRTPLRADTPYGPVAFQIGRLRGLPERLAA